MSDVLMVQAVAEGVSIGAVVTIGLGAIVSLVCAGIRTFRVFLG